MILSSLDKRHRFPPEIISYRACDRHGECLGTLVQSRGDKQAAQHFSQKVVKEWHYLPRVIITEQRFQVGQKVTRLRTSA